ncbi:MAG: flagellar M-ring protein FliF C-terminal domain-containing protein, partial [Candidatus Sulfotelmatobacter sp.]
SEQAQLAIPQLVASAVDRLRPENVTVVDADSNTPLVHGREGGRAYAPDEELAKTLVRTLEPVVGADHVRASVHVEYDLGTSEDTQEVYDPKTTATLTQEHSEENSTGTAPAGVPGTASNVPAATAPAAAPGAPPAATPAGTASIPTPSPVAASAAALGAEQSSSRSDSTTYAISKSLHRSVEPAGRVRRIAAAVLVDDAVEVTEQAGKRTTARRKRTADEMKEIEQLARAAIGVDAQRGDVLAVENLSFQELPLETPLPPAKSEHWRRLLEPWLWVLRYLALAALFLVVYALVLRPVKKQAIAAFRELPKKLAQRNSAQPLPASGVAGLAGESGLPQGEGQRTQQLTRMLTDKVKAEPAAASRLVESWVREGEEK